MAIDTEVKHNWPDVGLSRRPTVPLYHYTSRVGLKGILDSSKVWTSSCAFLNDSSEFSYAARMLKERAQRRYASSSNWLERQLLNHAIELDGSNVKLQVCVFSLSEDGDSLSQWRAYGRSGDAYAIGFDGAKLADDVAWQNVMLAPCLYREKEQHAAVDHAVEILLDRARASGLGPAEAKQTPWPSELTALVGTATAAWIQLSALLKNPAFQEEHEWRLVRMGGEVKFRDGRSHLVPYTEVQIGTALYDRLIHEVVIGPSPAPEVDEAALRWYLNERLGGSTPIRHSRAPYRAW